MYGREIKHILSYVVYFSQFYFIKAVTSFAKWKSSHTNRCVSNVMRVYFQGGRVSLVPGPGGGRVMGVGYPRRGECNWGGGR